MIKKSISFVMIIAILLLFYQMGVNYFKNSHNVTYTSKNNNMLFKIDEKYIMDKDNDYYLINVNYKDQDFVFDTDNLFNKQSEIVEKVNVYNENNILCLALDYVNNIESSMPVCYENNRLVAFDIVKNKFNFDKYIKSLKSTKIEEMEKLEKNDLFYEDISINLGYLGEENVLVYAYKRMVLINKNRRDYFVFANYDIYKNTFGYRLNEYYIVPKLSSSPVIDEFIVYNIENGLQKDIEINDPISKQIFINGDFENKLYLFDKSNLKQYTIDPVNLKFEEVANEEKEGINIQNGKKESISVYSLKNDITFTSNKEKYRSIDYDEIYENPRGKYIVYKKDGEYFKAYKESLNNPILIIKNNKISNFKAEKENVYYLEDTTIYKRNKYGIFPILTRNEFKYNKDRIFDIYVKWYKKKNK